MNAVAAYVDTEYANVQRGGQTIDAAAEQRWMVAYAPLVKRVARSLGSLANGSIDRDDLEQIGLIGLLEALRRYGEPDDGFRSYAVVRVRGAILDEMRRQDWRPRGARQGAHRLRATERSLRAQLGRDPSKTEISEALGIAPDEYDQMVLDDHAQAFASFDDLLTEQGDIPGTQQGPEALAIDRASLAKALLVLDTREQRVIQLYYEFELSLSEIAAVLGLTAARICQINKSALRKMKAFMELD